MNSRKIPGDKFIELVKLKVRFATSSLVATLLDYGIYLTLVTYWLEPVPSNIISYSCGFLINFFIQKRFIFLLKRKLYHVFMLSLLFSLLGLILSSFLIWSLNHSPFLMDNQYLTKLLVTGIVFFYNFYTKQYSFESK